MKTGYHNLFLIIAIILLPSELLAQVSPIKQWEKTFGGDNYDILKIMIPTPDGGFILGGETSSDKEKNKTENLRGRVDYLIVKIDAEGNKVWDKTFGGSGDDNLISLIQTPDRGYLLGGNSYSPISGDKSQGANGSYDIWLVKVDPTGNKLWDKTLGGNDSDNLWKVKTTKDGGFIVGCTSDSNQSGDKSENNRCGTAELWVIKLDDKGNKQWDKTLGGPNQDLFTDIYETKNGEYIIGSWSDSEGHPEVPCLSDFKQKPKGYQDFWFVKLDQKGKIVWDNIIGGNGNDILLSFEETSDGGYILAAYSGSSKSGDKSENGRTDSDIWVVKLNAKGKKEWDKTLPGTFINKFAKLVPTLDNGFVVCWNISEKISFEVPNNKSKWAKPKVKTRWENRGFTIAKLDATGKVKWSKDFSKTDGEISGVNQVNNGAIILTGNTTYEEAGKRNTRIWLMALDQKGKITSTETLKQYSDERIKIFEPINLILPTGNNEFLVAGKYFLTEENKQKSDIDFWVLKFRFGK